jgi:hypothetical protein
MLRPRSLARLRLCSCSLSFSPLFSIKLLSLSLSLYLSLAISAPCLELSQRVPHISSPSTSTNSRVRPPSHLLPFRCLGSGPRVALYGRILGENVPITRSWSGRKTRKEAESQ